MKRILPLMVALVVSVSGASLSGCPAPQNNQSQGPAKPVTVKGSDTMVILGQRFAERFMNQYPGTTIQITGGGSGTGIAALINGSTDIAQSSRPMKETEKQQVRERHNKEVIETPVALDGLAVYVHHSNPVNELTLAQVKAIYTGSITNWNAVGGKNAPIVLYSRENSSGTYEYFKEHVLNKEDFAATVQPLPGTAAVVNAVGKDPNAIGYGGIAYLEQVKPLRLKKDDASPAIPPTQEHVLAKTYPISRDLYFYTVGKPSNPVAIDFIRWVLSEQGQAVVREVEYFSLPEERRRAILAQW
ncbi:MAG: phosphate ABC transporter substrate-binding protein [Acidobacteriota bacterium]|nr:phosphate ABC transporter substrate-binding protein [Blastocatellia bacterium]MDW8238795.1 phosphate ABC transporter substrate-binding protein [Acidobacteriota bacterium]